MKRDLIFEIGTEEMPARAVEEGISSLRKKSPAVFEAARLAYDSIKIYGSPRRLAILVLGLAESQSQVAEEVKGPPANIAVDSKGGFTQAAYGFAKAQKIKPEKLEVREIAAGSYLFAKIERPGARTIDLLSGILLSLTGQIGFSKSMCWGKSEIRFSRPIRWLVAVFGTDIVSLELDSIPVSKYSRGHRFLNPAPIEINDPAGYLSALKNGWVVADQDERRQIILDGIAELSGEKKADAKDPSGVIDEVVHLAEWPTTVTGEFDSSFLEVPKEVLITAMQSHQRYFPLEKVDGTLIPAFITVHNGDPHQSKAIARGNERVLAARLSDAKFFFEEDIKKGLDAMVEELKNVTFFENLGSLFEKSERVASLATEVAALLGLPEETRVKSLRAARLCKADLVSDVVVEFPALQGTMGRVYSQRNGEDAEVSEAVFEHYLPRFAGDILPRTDSGVVLSIADKLDNIMGTISVGLIPTGSEDPYALRRQALGVINILVSRASSIDLEDLMRRVLDNLKSSNPEKDISQAKELFDGRMRQLLNSSGIRYDLVDSVMGLGSTDYYDLFLRAQALSRSLESSQLADLFVTFERCRNLSKNASSGNIDPDLLEPGAEKNIYDAFERVAASIQEPFSKAGYGPCLDLLVSLKAPVDRYFDDVLIMVKDESLRENRLRLIREISLLFEKIALFEKIVETGD